ncbi:MAG: Hsp20/alpha crystallin family protein [Bacteroidetes bacterium]|nr:Hsp20/alpha crystallin family protein [Bacteroidota bacterium]HET6245217.1 Hsp20/alpha crystallin family protein [Bacteroidia bacterium]
MALTELKKRRDEERVPDVFRGVSNLFDEFLRNEFLTRETGFVPGVNISEDNENFFVEVAVPGYTKEDIKVEMNNHILTISAEKKEEEVMEVEKTFTRREFSYGSFSRTLALPETVREEKIKAKYENGILRFVLPKKEEAKPQPAKTIEIE